MITITETGNVYDIRGLASERVELVGKMTNGSTFLEVDTGNLYIYNKDSESWVKLG